MTPDQSAPSAQGDSIVTTDSEALTDAFNGDNKQLCGSIRALIELNDAGALVPHGIGGHARALLAAAYCRLGGDNDL